MKRFEINVRHEYRTAWGNQRLRKRWSSRVVQAFDTLDAAICAIELLKREDGHAYRVWDRETAQFAFNTREPAQEATE